MPVSGRVLYEVRREVSSNLDDLMLITAGVGTLPASLADTQPRPGAADEYKFSEVWAHTRSGRAWVTGSSYSGYIPTYTLSPAITGLAPGDPAELRQHIFKDRIDQTLLQAHDKLFGWAMVDATTTSLVGGAETSEYAVPSTWCALHTVEVLLGDGHYYALEPSDWELMRTGDVSTTKFKVALGRLGQLDGNTLRLRGYKNPTYPASEVTSFEVWTPFLVAAATAKLLTGPLDNPQSDPQGKLSNLQYWATQEESERKRARTAIAPNTQWFL